MGQGQRRELSSKELLERIGVVVGKPVAGDLAREDLDGLKGDLIPPLRERYVALKEARHYFHPGQMVSWKPGLRNRRWPASGQPGVILEVLQEPVLDTGEPGCTYFRERLDLIIGIFVDKGKNRGDFLAFHACSERFEPWPTGEV